MKQCVYYNIVRLVMGDVVHLMAQHQSRTSQHVKQQELIMDIKIKYLLGALLPLFVHNLTYIILHKFSFKFKKNSRTF